MDFLEDYTMDPDYKLRTSMGMQASAKAERGGSVISPIIQGNTLTNLTINISGSLNQNVGEERALKIDHTLLKEVKSHHKSMLLRKFEHVTECVARNGERRLLKDLFTEVLMTQDEMEEPFSSLDSSNAEVPKDLERVHTVQRGDIFKAGSRQKRIRTVLTTGIAGIGKTMSVQKFIFDWASGVSSQEFDFVCVFPLRELSLVRKEVSFQELLWQYYPHLRRCENLLSEDSVHFLFIFDGLDESKHTLDFFKCPPFQEERKATTVDVLLTNIIRGDLFPGASVWITSRWSAACQTTVGFMDRITEIQGFDDQGKEEYFQKKCQDEAVADKIIAHIKSHRCLYHMCNMPSFCWVLASVFGHTLQWDSSTHVPRVLTEIYTEYLLILLTTQRQKYQDGVGLSQFSLMESNRDAILSLGRLAFEHLERGDVVFYEWDLRRYHISFDSPSFYTGVCKEIFLQDTLSLHGSVYSFIHLTLQEYFAALYVFACQRNSRRNVLKRRKGVFGHLGSPPSLLDVLTSGLKRSIKNRNGHLDMFIRFLLGLCTKHNQNLLGGLFLESEHYSDTIQQITHYIKGLIQKDIHPEGCINLFHCLNELNDHSLVEELKTALDSGRLSKDVLQPCQYSALAFMFQMSQGEVDDLNLRLLRIREDGVLRMLPIAKYYRSVRLYQCCLTSRSCADLSRLLISEHSRLTELDLSWNILLDAGVKLLCSGLTHPICKLRKLWLRHCGLTQVSCEVLAGVLTTTSSLRELDLAWNPIQDHGLKLLCVGLTHPSCQLQKLWLMSCHLTADCGAALASCLRESQPGLRDLCLGRNEQLGDKGVRSLSAGLRSPHCHLERLWLHCCGLTAACCKDLAAALSVEQSSLKMLALSINYLGDAGLTALWPGLQSPHCKLEELGSAPCRLEACSLTSESCETLASTISACHSRLRFLDLGVNALKDTGVALLCAGLKSPNCKVQKLILKGCGLTSKSCESVASAIHSAPLELSELNLQGNEMTDVAVESLISALKKPGSRLCNIILLGAQVSWALKGELISVLAELRQSGRDVTVQLDYKTTL
ncbi:NACHT, LRR and PYD domains-containing protein 12-like [Megalops cyprinoides]|uniref:NACHT, LRR and PYD domains-containing protein 12-like n=1 Tax=Megalops cyprinoides TaxID=118141 RepID=UPI0018649238|nr:NACHT, LRR and PYD domains-containing protein 12-like [Megalops cyprinoides]